MGNQPGFSSRSTAINRHYAEQPMVSRSARAIMRCMKRDSFPMTILTHKEFWHAWSHEEAAAFIVQHPLIPLEFRNKVRDTVRTEWTDFDIQGSPSFYKNRSLTAEKREYWDEHNCQCLWDDRLWLGLANQQLYMQFKIPKFKEGAARLLDMILQHNGNPRKKASYRGVFWKAQQWNYNNTITNVLLMTFLGRWLFIEQDSLYLEMLREQYRWLFKLPGKNINHSDKNIFPDWLDHGGNWTYNQAMPMEGLAYLLVFDEERMTEDYLFDLARLINGTIKYFRVSDKYICQELPEEEIRNPGNSDIIPNYLFRHLIMMRRVLGLRPGLWEALLARTPLLRIFLLDNFQAICKFESVMPGVQWDTDESRTHYFGSICIFYVSYAAYELFSIQEVVLHGIYIDCCGVLGVNFGKRVVQVQLITYKPNIATGHYEKDRAYELQNGRNDLNSLYPRGFCSPFNNHNVMGLKVIYDNGLTVNHTFAYIGMAGSKFALLTDVDGLDIVDMGGVRIAVPDSDKRYDRTQEYTSEVAQQQIGLSSSIDGVVWLTFKD